MDPLRPLLPYLLYPLNLLLSYPRFRAYYKRYIGASLVVFWILFLSAISLSIILPELSEEYLDPMVPVPQNVFWFIVGITIVVMILRSLYLFHSQEERNSVKYWMNNENIQKAMLEPIANLEDFETDLTPDELKNKRVILKCRTCDVEIVSRAHHCRVCNVCVFRRDHHCFITSGCLGLGNQRFFINTAIWCFIGCFTFLCFFYSFYMATCMVDFLPHKNDFEGVFGNFPNLTLLQFHRQHIMPLGYCISTLKPVHIFTFVVITATVASMLVSLGFAVWQLFLALYGYTAYEFKTEKVHTRLRPDGNGFMDRIRLLFGRNWLLNIFYPAFNDDPVITKTIAVNLVRPKNKDD